MIRGSLVRGSRGNISFAAVLLGTTAIAMSAVPAFAQVFARLCKRSRADPARPRERKIIFRVMAA